MTELMGEEEIFQQWLKSCLSASRDPIRKPEQAKPYEWIWLSWCRWLATPSPGADQRRAASWRDATYGQVMSFVGSGPSPAAKRKKKISEVTTRRYWRVLQRIYAFAVLRGQLAANPADIPEDLTEHPLKSERSAGVALTPRMWEQLQQILPAGDHWMDVRDRAVMRLFMELALTPDEVANLHAPHRDLLDPSNVVIDVVGSKDRPWQSRSLHPSPELLRDLCLWHEHRGRLTPGQAVGAHWFLTARLTPMSRHSLFDIVAPRVAKAAERSGMALPPHLGPMVLRNTRILQWLLQGRPLDQVLAESGLKEAKNLERLTVLVNNSLFSGYATPRRAGRPMPAL
ncbi:MAG: hypothetical protein HYX47_12760 [Burkholderiales bacterium]|nr:hypothetical protein [Burkholderiales bacterium]